MFTVRAVIEVAGYPKEHLDKILHGVIEQLKNEKGITLVKETFSEAKEVKEQIHLALVDCELKIENFLRLNHFCFFYLPSSIEIIDAEKFNVQARDLTSALNDLLAKLHEQNMLLYNISAENKLLKKKLKPETQAATRTRARQEIKAKEENQKEKTENQNNQKEKSPPTE